MRQPPCNWRAGGLPSKEWSPPYDGPLPAHQIQSTSNLLHGHLAVRRSHMCNNRSRRGIPSHSKEFPTKTLSTHQRDLAACGNEELDLNAWAGAQEVEGYIQSWVFERPSHESCGWYSGRLFGVHRHSSKACGREGYLLAGRCHHEGHRGYHRQGGTVSIETRTILMQSLISLTETSGCTLRLPRTTLWQLSGTS